MAEEPTPLEREIRQRIARTGPVPVAEFMALCLYDPQYGYYNRRDPFGAAGDFITAPEISQMFGELIGLWAATVWQSMGAPDPVLGEIGVAIVVRERAEPLAITVTDEERAAHRRFVETLGADAIWRDYITLD